MNVLLTGEIGVGKSTVCQRLAELARRESHLLSGALERSLFDATGRKVGIEMVDLASGERQVLARRDMDLGGPRVGRYSFAPNALAWRQVVIAHSPPSDLLIIDELGPLELEVTESLTWVRVTLQAGRAKHSVIVVRSSLVERLRQRLAKVSFTPLSVSKANRDSLPSEIYQMLFPRGERNLGGAG